MSKIKNKVSRVFFLLLFVLTCLNISCSKDLITPNNDIGTEIPIPVLTEYLGNLIDVNPDELSFNNETGYFQYKGVNQIKRDKLTFAYKLNKN